VRSPVAIVREGERVDIYAFILGNLAFDGQSDVLFGIHDRRERVYA
jgi:hypothetical protein